MKYGSIRYSKQGHRNHDIQARRNDKNCRFKSLGYYKIKQRILQQNLSRYYIFKRAEKLCKYFQQIHKHTEERRRTESRGQISMVRPK